MKTNPVIQLLMQLIKIDSRNPFTISYNENTDEWILGGNETEISEFLVSKLKDNGFKTELQFVHSDEKGNKFYNVLAEKGEGSKSILFYAHMDTVTANPWNSVEEALTPVLKKRAVYGAEKETLVSLGANDMKAGISIILEATKELTNEDLKDHKIKIIFGVDEEFYSLGSNAIKKDNEFMKDVTAIVIPEIGDGPNGFYGPSTIGIGRLGRCEFEIEIFGTGGHGAVSKWPEFINACYETTKLVNELEKVRLAHVDSFEFFNSQVPDKDAINVTEGSFFISKIDCGDGTLSIPNRGKIIVDFTFTPNFTIDKAEELLNNVIDDLYKREVLRKVVIDGVFKKIIVKLRKRPTPHNEAYLTGENHNFTKFVKQTIEKEDIFLNYNMGYSVADENVFKRTFPHIPVIVLGPTASNSHKADEWVDIDSVIRLLKVYKSLAKEFNNYNN